MEQVGRRTCLVQKAVTFFPLCASSWLIRLAPCSCFTLEVRRRGGGGEGKRGEWRGEKKKYLFLLTSHCEIGWSLVEGNVQIYQC